MTNRTELRDLIIERGRAMYSRFGWRDSLTDELADIIETAPADDPWGDGAADKFRNRLWSAFPGGGPSAQVTREVFAALGRAGECDLEWS